MKPRTKWNVFAFLFAVSLITSACGSAKPSLSSQPDTAATTAAAATLASGGTDSALTSDGSFGNLSSSQAADGATSSGVSKAGGNRAFGDDTYENNSTKVDQINGNLAAFFAAGNDETGYAAIESVINVNRSTGSLYVMAVATPKEIAAANQTACDLPNNCGGGSGGTPTPPADDPVCGDAFYSQANACTIMLNYLCQTDASGKVVCDIPCSAGTCQDAAALDSGNLMTCEDPSAFTTCCAYSCKASSPGCYTPDQQIERTFGNYAAASEPITSVVSLDRSSTLGQLNFKESHVAYFSRDAAPTAQPMRRLSTNCGVELEVTPTHAFVGIDGRIKLAASYNVGDLLLTEDGSLCEITRISDFDKMHGNEKTFQAFNVAVDTDELTEQVIVARGSGRGYGILTGSHWFQDHDISRFGRALARERIRKEIKP